MPLIKPYNAVFNLEDPILPDRMTYFENWYGYGARRTLIRLLTVAILNKHVAQGHFIMPGTYLLHVHRKGFKMHAHLMRIGAPGASVHVIREYVRDHPDPDLT